MASLNKVQLIGNLGKDPEIRHTAENRSVANFTLATTRRYTDRNKNKVESTEWHNIVVWGKLAEIAEKYLKKGKQIYVEGRLQTRNWDDDSGNKHYMTEVVAENFLMLGSKKDQSEGAGYQGAEEPAGATASETGGNEEDDLPF